MAQGTLAFKYEAEETGSGMTALAGLPLYMELGVVSGLVASIKRHLHIRSHGEGWSDPDVVMSIVLLNIAGGDCVEDLRLLAADEGACRVMRHVRTHGLTRKERRRQQRRLRKLGERAVPSPSSVFRYLHKFHDQRQEALREAHKAFIPAPNEHLQALYRVNADLLAFVQSRSPSATATMDGDATLTETHKQDALYCYKHFKAYQPLNFWWHEQGMVVHSEFRDGNVNAGYEQLRAFKDALAMLPSGVDKVLMRSDSAGYQQELLIYCAEGKNERFGVIEFAVSADVTEEFRKAVAELGEEDWQPLRSKIGDMLVDTGQQWAEVCFVPKWAGYKKNGPNYRFLAIREPLHEADLPGLENSQMTLPFPTMVFSSKGRCKLFGVVTNRDLPGEEVIHWLRGRCGKSEEAHAVMKEDLAGGKLPSGDFGENAAWWGMMILAHNLNSAMKRLVLPESYLTKRLKAIRFAIINLPARVMWHARSLSVRLRDGHPALEMLVEARRRMWCLAHGVAA